MNHAPHRYSVYGVEVTSEWALSLPAPGRGMARVAAVDFVSGSDEDFADLELPADPERHWFQTCVCPDGSIYARWAGLYEFRILADGTRVACRPLNGSDRAVLQNFLFAPALSFALVHQGLEPLHASVVQVDEMAIAFLGDCTFGKSTFLASFLQAGHRVVTDDLLVIERGTGVPRALPGSGRIKLMPDSATAFLADVSRGTPLNPRTNKRSFVVDEARKQREGLPLTHLFLLPTPEERDASLSIDIRPLSRATMVRQLLKSTFNTEILDRERLARQFAFVTALASEVNGAALSYPSGLQHLPAVRRGILDHIRGTVVIDGVHDSLREAPSDIHEKNSGA